MTRTDSQPAYVGFWARMGAFLLDSVFATGLLYPLWRVINGLTGLDAVPNIALNDEPEQLALLLEQLVTRLSIELVILAGVFIGLWIYLGATPGKLMFKSCIVDARTLGPASPVQFCLRYIGYFVSLLPFGFGFVWIALDRRKQGWHDKIARTVVITRRPGETA